MVAQQVDRTQEPVQIGILHVRSWFDLGANGGAADAHDRTKAQPGHRLPAENDHRDLLLECGGSDRAAVCRHTWWIDQPASAFERLIFFNGGFQSMNRCLDLKSRFRTCFTSTLEHGNRSGHRVVVEDASGILEKPQRTGFSFEELILFHRGDRHTELAGECFRVRGHVYSAFSSL